MEHNNATTTSTTNLRQQQQQQQQQSSREQQLTQKLQEQQLHHQQQQQTNNNNNENQQQFCLRWHNHQTSLLSTLPVLLDQSHLTDVTISAEGRTLRAHRVVLSACSSFFLEIFRTLESTHHPVIIIPGASFNAIVSLLTFMYSGEVNVYEEQIPMLLSLAETLGIKGLADVHNNLQKPCKTPADKEPLHSPKEELLKSPTPPSPPPTAASSTVNFTLPTTPASSANLNNSLPAANFNPLLSTKFPSPLENFFLKSLQFYPNLMHQPLNFSQTALNKTSDLLAKYQQQCNLYQANMAITPKDLLPSLMHSEEDLQMAKRFCSGLDKKTALSSQQLQQNQLSLQQQKDIKRIDKIVKNLRVSSNAASGSASSSSKLEKGASDNLSNSPLSTHLHAQLSPLSIKTSMDNYSSTPSPLINSKSSLFSNTSNTDTSSPLHSQLPYNISPEDQLKLQQHLDKYAQSCARTMEVANESLKNEAARLMSNEKLSSSQSPQTKPPSNSKLYATCFICHKQLSNQYNLRVHLETHQNVRYACNVCSHVSRSKDALRKHVSYRHPGAPSPCETEARRKRANKVLASQLNAAAMAHTSPSSGEVTPTSPNTLTHFPTASTTSSSSTTNDLNCNESSALTAAQLSSAYQMFMPNQFHLAAAAAQQQQHQQQTNEQQSPNCSVASLPPKDFSHNLSSATSSSTTSTFLNNTPCSPSHENTKSSPVPTNNSTTSPHNPNDLSNPTNTNNVEASLSPNLNTSN
ncbi:GATA zinc finger domain-containing protein 6 [Lucilia sericata]|uniref:GATA zinc finger domain-containing protein 6 n=1 Tax=Lucilia sericata TaxID=13632 RepID=UPI0018A8808E|nr:GATA zinc finger domain-containing protein 6 [Lucilia sericata]XP_037812809.1 GATA zinc finger domain-containing protein 6 [Lucilia sericata]XP_037812811.1 GATA zinc finger domain-containing protein 6 [Lucilia sericata]XP_037812812.1 GATA zinc finger domain-containing protein 6 [Lucilia sericata]XP_037812813.1 GATA zinc finger domain-containing protein 6 [Lucilia sericata]XP_037812814.1 GATA zinc finger domain-containing protein 6 [Lucilia sericata]